MAISTDNINVNLNGNDILQNVSINVGDHEFIGIIGPNGSGKSTLLKCIYRVLSPTGGVVLLDGKPLNHHSVRDSARKMAVVTQHNNVVFDFTVLEMVLIGRSPHKHTLERDNAEDYRIARTALDIVGLAGFEERVFTSLSGGEQQRVILAQALTQQTPCLILDEPTNHLDIKYQLQVMSIVKKLNKTVIAAIHDLNIAAMYCDKLYVLANGKIIAQGPPEQVLTYELIQSVYEVEADITHTKTGAINIVYQPMVMD